LAAGPVPGPRSGLAPLGGQGTRPAEPARLCDSVSIGRPRPATGTCSPTGRPRHSGMASDLPAPWDAFLAAVDGALTEPVALHCLAASWWRPATACRGRPMISTTSKSCQGISARSSTPWRVGSRRWRISTRYTQVNAVRAKTPACVHVLLANGPTLSGRAGAGRTLESRGPRRPPGPLQRLVIPPLVRPRACVLRSAEHRRPRTERVGSARHVPLVLPRCTRRRCNLNRGAPPRLPRCRSFSSAS
jgi:hypothetical protein